MEAPGLCRTPIPSCRPKRLGKGGPHVGTHFCTVPPRSRAAAEQRIPRKEPRGHPPLALLPSTLPPLAPLPSTPLPSALLPLTSPTLTPPALSPAALDPACPQPRLPLTPPPSAPPALGPAPAPAARCPAAGPSALSLFSAPAGPAQQGAAEHAEARRPSGRGRGPGVLRQAHGPDRGTVASTPCTRPSRVPGGVVSTPVCQPPHQWWPGHRLPHTAWRGGGPRARPHWEVALLVHPDQAVRTCRGTRGRPRDTTWKHGP